MGDVLDYPDARAFVEAMPSTSPILHYVEAQYHGPVTLADVEEVIFLKEPPSEEMRRLLKARGIEFQEPGGTKKASEGPRSSPDDHEEGGVK